MASSFFALFDDIATLLDDVAVLSKVAARQTTGVIGDDLALNAKQVAGVRAERELPVVWAVAKGSLVNKAILVPVAILLSVFVPWLVHPLLMIGGTYLCFEGVEKLLHARTAKRRPEDILAAEGTRDPVDPVSLEREKIKGAIRTDFVLSAEIMVIALGSVSEVALLTRILVMAVIALVMTGGVYGVVALIVKLDDMGLYLAERSGSVVLSKLGSGLVATAPLLMKVLSVAGTIAMFLVGGGILAHNIGPVHHLVEVVRNLAGGTVGSLLGSLLEGLTGILAGALVLACVALVAKIRGKSAH
ncbi:MAG TPA: DUF808 domain-containing protein [Fibrobacteria bacterium]|nr:DUF808 domain-containing protein [Fibrobacteria bacterium]HOX49920.1 DUF808 domain-containing protein [Fibrobacteria bacterium]